MLEINCETTRGSIASGRMEACVRFSLLLIWGTTYAVQIPAVSREQHPEIGRPGSGLLLPSRILEHTPEIGWVWCLHT